MMNKHPNKWVAVILSVVANPLGLLYVGAPAIAAAVFLLTCLLAVLDFMQIGGDMALRPFMALVLPVVVISAVVAYRRAARAGADTQRPWWSRWTGLLGIAVLYIVATMAMRIFLFEPFRIPSTAMEPNLPVGANIIVKKWGYGHYTSFGLNLGRTAITAPMARGDIIVFDFPRDPTQTYIKRLIGLPGDQVQYKAGRLSVNGVEASVRPVGDYRSSERNMELDRQRETLGQVEYDIARFKMARPTPVPLAFAHDDQCSFGYQELSCTVPQGHYFMMGDNRDNSADSRLWGFVPANLVIGKVVSVFR